MFFKEKFYEFLQEAEDSKYLMMKVRFDNMLCAFENQRHAVRNQLISVDHLLSVITK